jgi:hypothetical protein
VEGIALFGLLAALPDTALDAAICCGDRLVSSTGPATGPSRMMW